MNRAFVQIDFDENPTVYRGILLRIGHGPTHTINTGDFVTDWNTCLVPSLSGVDAVEFASSVPLFMNEIRYQLDPDTTCTIPVHASGDGPLSYLAMSTKWGLTVSMFSMYVRGNTALWDNDSEVEAHVKDGIHVALVTSQNQMPSRHVDIIADSLQKMMDLAVQNEGYEIAAAIRDMRVSFKASVEVACDLASSR